jgi:benzoate membrane transport protein
MSTDARGWFGLISAATTAVVIGFASTILVIMEAARAVGATPAQQASWAAALCLGMAVTSFYLSWRYRMPIITAWSTPGAAVIATSAAGVTYQNALGAFLVAGLLMVVAGLIKPLEKAIEKIPAPVAAAMLAGVLLRYTLGVPAAAISAPMFVLPLVAVFFSLRIIAPLYAVPWRRSAAALPMTAATSDSRRWCGPRRDSTGRRFSPSACRSFSSPWPRRICRDLQCCAPAATSRRCSRRWW